MTPRIVGLSGSNAHRFLWEHDCLHDAEIQSISVSQDGEILKVGLCGLTYVVGEMKDWRGTDTKATLVFEGISDLKRSGELVEYSVLRLRLMSENILHLVSNVGGVLEASFKGFGVDVEFASEANTYV